MKKVAVILTVISMLAAFYVWFSDWEAGFALATDLEMSDIRVEVHILTDTINELDAQVFALEWQAKIRPLDEQETRQLRKKSRQLADAEKRKELYLDRVVK